MKNNTFHWWNLCLLFLGLSLQAKHTKSLQLTAEQKKDIGHRIWQNESGKQYNKLVFWKENENFPSLGIAHFIWYPHKNADIFEQTFPELLAYFKKKKVKLPAWLAHAKYAPWKSKAEFDAASQSSQTQELRQLMFDTIDLQVEFIINRLEHAWPRIKKHAEASKRSFVQQNYDALRQAPEGTFALIDYLNFKGEGTNPKERYNGMGWGLLQVLENMESPIPIPRTLRTNGQNNQKYINKKISVRPEHARGNERIIENFVTSARHVLEARISNAPADKKHEKEWLRGWLNRVDRYLNP